MIGNEHRYPWFYGSGGGGLIRTAIKYTLFTWICCHKSTVHAYYEKKNYEGKRK